MKSVLYICLLLSTCLTLPAQSPDREFRGMWIATVKNIDWPSKPGLSSDISKQELRELLDSLHSHGFNAVVLQVRPAGDAFYDSPYEPWSEWLTGAQGAEPVPYYDPLQFAISEAHRRNMELHAWVNPFRALMDGDSSRQMSRQHIAYRHPEWILKYGSIYYLDPGVPMARDYVTDVVMDIVDRYDIDAIHFDDYFYPYAIADQEFPDTLSYRIFGGRYADKNAWRRNNIDEFIHQLHDSILASKPEVELGISPFAVWRNEADDPEGSATRAGITSYGDLHADVRKWLRFGWIDYVAPQIYFSVGYPPADFSVLLDWWEQNSYGKHLYIGHAAYKVANNSDQNWNDPAELPGQIDMVRRSRVAQGSIFFSARWLDTNTLGWADSLQTHTYLRPAFPPGMSWLDGTPPLPPVQADIASTKEGMELFWLDSRNPDAEYYCVYRYGKGEFIDPDMDHLVSIQRDQGTYFLDYDVQFLRKYTYLITTRDKQHNESEPIMVQKRTWRRVRN